MKQRLLSLVMILLLACGGARAEETAGCAVTDVGLDLLGSSIHYPQLTGLADVEIQSAVNAGIMEAGCINERLTRMAALANAPVKLNVSYTHMLTADVFSCAILAEGAVETSRSTQVWSTLNVDLRTGREIGFGDLFSDTDAALEAIAVLLDEQIAPELSAHLAAGSLTPVPARFTLSPTGLTLYYDIDSFRTLSDRAGTVTLLWTELRTHLRLEADDVLTVIGAAEQLTLDEASADKMAEALSGGALPGIPAAMGQPMQSLIDRYALLNDPDIYEGGRMIALEDGAFREAWLLTDALTEHFDTSVVQGIRADRLNFFGLCTDVTTRDEWRAALGAPQTTLTVDENRADSWRIVPGTSDYYALGEYRLRLHADEEGVLRTVFLTRSFN